MDGHRKDPLINCLSLRRNSQTGISEHQEARPARFLNVSVLRSEYLRVLKQTNDSEHDRGV